MPDLPDYEKKVIVVTIPGDYPAEMRVDLIKLLGEAVKPPTVAHCIPVSIEHVADINHKQILGEALKNPTFANCVPTSIENDAIAYDGANDRFKVDIQALTVGVIPVSLSTLLNPHPVTQTDETLLKATVTQAAKDRTVTGTVTAEQATAANLKATVTQASIARTVTGTVTAEQTTAANLKATVEQATAASLNATVTQAAKDRTVSSVDATATPVQINISALNGNSAALKTPAGGKALRLKFISIEHSADVDIGYRFGAAGQIEYLRITKGLYISNLIGCNNQGAADAALYINSSAATNVKGYILVTEV